MIPYLLIILAFAADRVTKWWAAENLVEFRPVEVNEFLTLHATYNRGVAFGLLQGIGPIIGWLSILIVLGLLVHMIRTPKRFWLLRLGLAMIIGGALGNMIDRITVGEVLDFIQVAFLPGIFNISDVLVNAGMVVSLVAVTFQKEEETEETGASGTVDTEAGFVSGLGAENGEDLESTAAGQEGEDKEQHSYDPGGNPQTRFPVDVEQRS